LAAEPVRWRSVWGLAALQGAVSLAWLIYNLYVPQLLEGLGFAEGFVLKLLILEQAVAAVVEPLAGAVSDRLRQWLGGNFLLVAGGASLSAALFVAIPAVVVGGGEGWRWGAVVFVALWAIAMAAFRGPALALVASYASPSQWPAAMGVVTLVGGLVGALRPLTTTFWLGLGPMVAFGIGSVALLGTMAVLRRCHPPSVVLPLMVTPPWRSLPVLGRLLLIGAATAWGMRLLMGVAVAAIAERYSPEEVLSVWLGLAGLLFGLAAWPAGKITTYFGVRGTVAIAAGLSAVGLALLPIVQGPFVALPAVLALVVGVSTVFNGGVPLALQGLPPVWGSLAVGMYFGGFSAAMGAFGWLWPQAPDLSTTGWMGAIAFGMVGGLAFTIPRWPGVTPTIL